MNTAAFHKPFSRRTPGQWQHIINDQKVSGLTQQAYCRQQGLSLATYCNWKKKLACHESLDDISPTAPPVNDWVEVPAPDNEPPSNRWDMELELPGGVTLRMRNRTKQFSVPALTNLFLVPVKIQVTSILAQRVYSLMQIYLLFWLWLIHIWLCRRRGLPMLFCLPS